MRLLLDTGTFIWAALDPARIPAPALAQLSNVDNDRLLSAVVCWEFAIKWRLGRLAPQLDSLDGMFEAQVTRMSLRDLPITREHALRTSRLPRLHGDPFDRLLVAQAQVEGAVLVTPDQVLSRYGIGTLW